MEDNREGRRAQVKVPHNLRFHAGRAIQELQIMDKAWSGFLAKVRDMANYQMEQDKASAFFDDPVPSEEWQRVLK
jgi:hypothetical protein